MRCMTKKYDLCDISGFQDSINRTYAEDNTKTNLRSQSTL